MSPPSSLLLARWRSRKLVAQNRHALVIRVRPGHITRGYASSKRIDNGSWIYPPLIWEGRNHSCWKGEWTPTGPWVTLPSIESFKWTRAFDSNGSSSATVVMDNIAFPDAEGIAGLYHTIARGYYSPMRGANVRERPHLWQPNQWKDVLNAGYQVEAWEGYGAGDEVVPLDEPDPDTHSCQPPGGAISRTWTGLIEDCELDSHPDKITLTARDFGVLFTDQRMMGWNIAREIRSPVTFCDRKRAQGEEKITSPLHKSSGQFVKGDGQDAGDAWLSAPQGASADTQWVEVELKGGHYEDFAVAPAFKGMDVYVSLKTKGQCYIDRVHRLPIGEWVDLGFGSTPDGTPYIGAFHNMAKLPVHKWHFPRVLDVNDGTILRFTFSNLHYGDQNGNSGYYAGVNEVAGFRFHTDPAKFLSGTGTGGGIPTKGTQLTCKHWIMVEDAADVVRMLCIWAGFKEWHVEDFGWSIKQPYQANQDKFFIDVINYMLKQGNFVFYMGAPTNDDRSIGVPHFEPQTAVTAAPRNMIEVRDTDLLEAMKVKWDLSSLPFVMRYRGAIVPEKQISGGGQTLFQDLTRRYMATYFPPWTGGAYRLHTGSESGGGGVMIHNRVAGVIRQFSETLGDFVVMALDSNDECLFACVLAAIQYGLAMATTQLQIPGLPGFELNQLISVIEAATGANSRIWLATVESDHTMGEKGAWHMTISGSYLDTEDMSALMDDYAYTYDLNQRHQGMGASKGWPTSVPQDITYPLG